MNKELLEAIQEQEAIHGSVASPFADLRKIHGIVKRLDMYGARFNNRKHYYWYSIVAGEYHTYSNELVQMFNLFKRGFSQKQTRSKIRGIDTGMLSQVHQIQKAHYDLKLVSEA